MEEETVGVAGGGGGGGGGRTRPIQIHGRKEARKIWIALCMRGVSVKV